MKRWLIVGAGALAVVLAVAFMAELDLHLARPRPTHACGTGIEVERCT
jgi:hypothetical protein